MSAAAQTVMITGAAGHLGRAVAAAFQGRGASLVLVDRDAEALQKAFGHLDATLLAADLLNREALAETVRGVGCIDVLCHLVGGFRMGEPVHATAPATWDFLMDLNVRSLLNVAAAVVPQLVAQGAGKVVTVGAGAAHKGSANMGAYAASKSALIRLTESMSAELRDQGIHVNCVLPSIIDTPDNRAAMPDADFARWVAPDALADAILFLASDAARALHGAALAVTGRV